MGNSETDPMLAPKVASIQEVYDVLENLAFCEGVPGVAEWIRNSLNAEYGIKLDYDVELDLLP